MDLLLNIFAYFKIIIRDVFRKNDSRTDAGRNCSLAAGCSSATVTSTSCVGNRPFEIKLLKSLELSKDPECRVMDYCNNMSLLVCSQLSANALFPGFGVRKVR